MFDSRFPVHEHGGYRFLDEGPDTGRGTLVMLHGMIGGPGNWDAAIPAAVAAGWRVLVPYLPVYGLPVNRSTIPGLTDWVRGFLAHLGIDQPVVAGNSLGGHIALFLALGHPEAVRALVLVGASGVYEVDVGVSVMRRNDREFVRERAALTFFDDVHVTDRLLDEVIETINDRHKALRLIRLARSAKKETVTGQLSSIAAPTLVAWGRQDRITPPDVAEELDRQIPSSRLVWLDRCGHAPMLERPEAFNDALGSFLEAVDSGALRGAGESRA